MDDLQRIGIVFAVNVVKNSSKLDDLSRDSNAISLIWILNQSFDDYRPLHK